MSSENIKYTKLYVKNFAKIKEAEIELAPFTLFVGDNNSGKSYLSTLIYVLMKHPINIIEIIFNIKELEELEEYKKVKDIIKNYINNLDLDVFYNLDEEKIKIIVKLFNFLLNKNLNTVINFIFNSNDGIEIEKINLVFDYSDTNFQIRKIEEDDIYIFEVSKNKGSNSSLVYSFRETDYLGIIKRFISFIYNFDNRYINEILPNNSTIFFPVSRTGFLLSKNDILDSAISSKYDKYADRSMQCLSRPTINFLKHLNRLSRNVKKSSNFQDLVKFIENNIIDGKINIQSETGSIYYIPNNNNNKKDLIILPMYLTSAVVTEIAPLYLFLKYGIINENFIMEEPEISLHPKLQQQLTRVFIKLINSRSNILITTHSDTILQHINNMIKLNNNEDERRKELMEKYNYDEDDLISEEKIRMYQFDVEEDGYTKVSKLRSSKYGFEVPTFNDILRNISNEIYDFQEELE